jgi:tRNA1Val (adenine37-N6)-methyltransferase
MGSLSDKDLFRFKKFSLVQGRTAMRINTDGVLIGAWATLSHNCNNILDIGTGCGTIAIIIAQRLNELYSEHNSRFSITCIEPHGGSFCDAKENFESASLLFSKRQGQEREQWNINEKESGIFFNIINLTLKDYLYSCESKCMGKVDLIISNPPYFSHSLKSTNADKSLVRHADALPHSEIIWATEKLLSAEGRLVLILPNNEADSFIRKILITGQFGLERVCRVRTTPNKPCTRYMMEFGRKQKCPPKLIEEQLTLMENNKFTIPYMELTQSFYINF